MDRKTIIAFILIGFILVLTQTTFYREKILKLPPPTETTQLVPDDSKIENQSEAVHEPEKPKITAAETGAVKTESEEDLSAAQKTPLAARLAEDEKKEAEAVVVETENYIAHIGTKGAQVTNWTLKKYNYTKNELVQLIQDGGYGNLGVFFIHNEDTLHTFDAIFEPDRKYVKFERGRNTEKVKFTLDLGNGKQLVKTFQFYKDEYIIDLNIEIIQLATSFDNREYFLTWKSGLNYTEVDYSNHISKEDVDYSKAYVYQGGSKEELKLPNKPFEKNSRSDFSGLVDWTAIRTKYFAMIILPETDYEIQPILEGETYPIYRQDNLKDRVKKVFSVTLKNKIPLSTNINSVSQNFRVYIGPMDYFIIKDYHPTLGKIMDFGISLIRPFAKLVLNVFIFLHQFIPNYGVVLVIFSILVKVLVWPLTRKSYASMQRMQTLQPKLAELKEKYAKDPQRLNKETMKMYKQEGVNPVSGCLPQLLQMPLLFAIFIVFRNTIELRDEGFIFWIKDLSAPDTIFQLPFSIPFYGDLVNVLPLVMGATMFLQQKMTTKDPKQKALVYFMPIFLTLLFNSFPSGLNLYYTLFNLFSILQQKYSSPMKTEEENNLTKKAPKPVKKIIGSNKESKKK